ncbi:Uncharacterised protein [Campylobacter coli]|nr:hypothetical protein [Campylobacter coli]MBX1735754.1 hypothetical protein [Campylobacter coli]VUA73699.1 Uncharacterised protein [Campylobacter coli]
MAFFAGMSGQNPLIEGERTIEGKLLGYDKNMSQSQVEDLNEFINQNPIEWSITGDVFADSVYITKLRNTITDIDEFKKQWLEMKAKSDKMGEVYQTEIANKKEVVSSQETSEEGKEKPFKPIQAESKSETYKDDNKMNELVKKLLETKFGTSDELELLFGMKFSDDDIGEFNKFLSQNTSAKIIDIKA